MLTECIFSFKSKYFFALLKDFARQADLHCDIYFVGVVHN